MLEIIKGEKEDVYCYGWDAHSGGNVTIDTAVFQVYDADDTSVQSQASATITDNGTATPDVCGLVDTSTSSFVAGDSYYVLFTMNIGTQIQKHPVWFVIT